MDFLLVVAVVAIIVGVIVYRAMFVGKKSFICRKCDDMFFYPKREYRKYKKQFDAGDRILRCPHCKEEVKVYG